MDILANKVLLTVLSAAVLLGAAVCLILYIKKRKHRKELKRLAEDKQRELALESILENKCAAGQLIKPDPKPYDVNYGQMDRNAQGSSSHIMIQLIEKSELSARKFVFDPAERITIGSQYEKNTITIPGIEAFQCEIFLYDKNVYLKNTGKINYTLIKRKRQQVYATQEGVKLHSGDSIVLGKVVFEFNIII